MVLRKILVPTDLSANSKAGIAYGISLAGERQADLFFLHVVSPPSSELAIVCEAYFCGQNWQPASLVQHRCREAARRLDQFLQGNFAESLGQLRWQAMVDFGATAQVITLTACREEADLIVMARRKRGIVLRAFSASIAESVSREAPCPVLTVCPPRIPPRRRASQLSINRRVLDASPV